jgi:DNA polymerase-3 subunit alpha
VGDRIAKAMPPLVMGRDTPLHACLTKTEGHEEGYAAAAELREMYETDPDAKEVIDVAWGSRGCGARTASTPPRWSSRATR